MRRHELAGLALSLLMIALLLLFSASAKPPFFSQSSSGDDLQELEAMLSGEHRGAAYTTSRNVSAPAPATQPQTTSAMDGLYAPPYRDIFLNDTFFGDFVRQWRGDAASATNLTWYQIFLNGSIYLAGSVQQPDGSKRRIKPVLIKQPEF